MGLLAQFSGNLLSLIAIPFYIEILGGDVFAVVLFSVTLQVWVMVLETGLSSAIVGEVSKLAVGKKFEQIGCIFLTGFISLAFAGLATTIVVYAALNFLSIKPLVLDSLKGINTSLVIVLILVLIIARLLESYIRGFFLGFCSFKIFFGSIIGSNLIRFAFTILILGFVDDSLEAFFMAQLIATIFSIVSLAVIFSRGTTPLRAARFDFKIVLPILRIATPLIGAALLVAIGTQLDRLYLAFYLPAINYSELLLALSVTGLIQNFSLSISQMYLPNAIDHSQKGGTALSFRSYEYYARLSFVAICLPAAFLATFSDHFLGYWLGENINVNNIYNYILIIWLPFLISGMISIPGQLPIIVGKPESLFKLNLILAILSLCISIILIPDFGEKALILNLFLGQSLGLLYLVFFASRIFGYDRILRLYLLNILPYGIIIFSFTFGLRILFRQ